MYFNDKIFVEHEKSLQSFERYKEMSDTENGLFIYKLINLMQRINCEASLSKACISVISSSNNDFIYRS